MRKTAALFFILLSITCKSQNRETLYWTRYAPAIEFKKWKINASVEDRVAVKRGERRNLLANIVFLYKMNDAVSLGAGFAHFTAYDEEKDGFSIPELRPFQQLNYSHESGKFNFDHRFRTEERFQRDTLRTERLDSYSYTFRARYRLELTFSITKKKEDIGHFGIQLKDEIFFSAGNIAENFDQNRLYGGVVYQMSKPLAFEIGYMWVNKNAIDEPDQNSDLVRITLRHNIDFK